MKVYVASFYGRRRGLSDFECQQNVDKCMVYVRKIIKMGHNPMPALLWHYIHKGWAGSPDETKYFELVSSWIKDCDVLFVAEMPPWENSGVHREIKIAEKLDIPVYYKLEDLPVEHKP